MYFLLLNGSLTYTQNRIQTVRLPCIRFICPLFNRVLCFACSCAPNIKDSQCPLLKISIVSFVVRVRVLRLEVDSVRQKSQVKIGLFSKNKLKKLPQRSDFPRIIHTQNPLVRRLLSFDDFSCSNYTRSRRLNKPSRYSSSIAYGK